MFLVLLFEIFIIELVLELRLWEAIIVFHTYEADRTDNAIMLLLVALTQLGLIISSNNHQFQGCASTFACTTKAKMET